MLQLLDVILPRIPDTTRSIPKKVLPDTGVVGQFSDNMLLTVLVVLCGLFLCFLFARRYRNH